MGTGDVFAALLLVWLEKSDNCLHTAVEHVLRTLHRLLAATLKYAQRTSDPENCANLELRLIQCKEILLTPPAYDLHVVEL